VIPDDRPRTLPRLLVDGMVMILLVMMLSLAVAVVIALCAGAARAEPCKRAYAVQEQDPSPCEGVLLPESDVRKLVECISADLPECKARLLAEQSLRLLDAEKAATLLNAAVERGELCCRALDECATITQPEVPWYQRPEFVVPVTLVPTAVVAVLLALWGAGVI